MSELSDKIKTRGYWQVRLLPLPFEGERVERLARLEEIVARSTVHFRGWDFPHSDEKTGVQRELDHVWNESQWSEYLEVWRFFKNGQFIDLAGMPEDWRDESILWKPPENWKQGATIGIFEVLYRFAEIFEFAARIAMTEAASDQIRVEVLLSGLQGRQLYMDDSRRSPLFRSRVANVIDVPYSVDIPREKLVAAPREFALRPAQQVFECFGFDMTLEALRAWQSELRN